MTHAWICQLINTKEAGLWQITRTTTSINSIQSINPNSIVESPMSQLQWNHFHRNDYQDSWVLHVAPGDEISLVILIEPNKSTRKIICHVSRTRLADRRNWWIWYPSQPQCYTCIIAKFDLVHIDISTMVWNVLIEAPFGDLASITVPISVSISASASPLATTLLSLCRWFPSLRKTKK